MASAGMTTAQAVEMVSPKIDAALLQYAEDKMAVRAWEAVIKALWLFPCLIWMQTAPVTQVGAHHENRKGIGYQVSTAVSIGLKHIQAGYSYIKACFGNYAVHVNPEHAAASLRWNNEKGTNQGLVPMSSILLEPIGGTHTNVFLRAVLSLLECDNPTLAPSGRLDPEFLGSLSPDLARALSQGLEWTVINPAIFSRWPQLLQLGMDVLNMKHTSDVSELEGVLAMREGYRNNGAPPGPGPAYDQAWSAAEASAKLLDPHWAGWSGHIRDFAKCVTDSQLKESAEFKNACVRTPKGVSSSHGYCGGAYLAKIASLSFQSKCLKSYPVLRMACYHAQIASPIQKCTDGKYDHMRPADLAKLTSKSKLEEVDAAQEMMNKARLMVASKVAELSASGISVASTKQASMQAIFCNDCRLVYFLCGKGKGSRFDKDWKSLDEVWKDFQADLDGLGSSSSGVGGAAAPSSSQVPSASVQPVLPSAAEMDSFSHQMQQKGWKKGQYLIRTHTENGEKVEPGGDTWIITEASDSKVKLRLVSYKTAYIAEAKCRQEVILADLLKQWRQVNLRNEPSKLEFGTMLPCMGKQLPILCQKAHILLAVSELYVLHKEHQGPMAVDIWENPSMVVSKKKYSARELKLVPTSTSVSAHAEALGLGATKNFVGNWDLEVAGEICQFSFTLTPQHSTKMGNENANLWVAPYWQVNTSPDNKFHNMIISHEVIKGIKLPVMTNNKVLQAGDKLVLWNYKPPAAPAAAAAAAAPPAKKQRKA